MVRTLHVVILVLFLYKSSASDIDSFYFPAYHLAPPKGWMNDPNGFCVFQSEYHLFYQFNPNSSYEPGIAHWGHAKSKDLFFWEDQPIAMYPDKSYDKSGVFSGSALVEDGKMFLFYTGNVNDPENDSNHEQRQALAISDDGINVKKYLNNPIIKGEQYQPNIRDPKVWKQNNSYYMVLGNSFTNEDNETFGRVLLYKSDNKIEWKKVSVLLESNGDLGYMFECPDFFELKGKYILLFSPQGIKAEGDNYKNLYQTGYVVGDFDYSSNEFNPLTTFRELDHGHDFYATQTTLNIKNQRIVIAWNDMWETNYPEAEEGFTGQMTLPRILSLSENMTLIQKPVKEITVALDRSIFEGNVEGGENFVLEENIGRIYLQASKFQDFEIFIESEDISRLVTIQYDYQNNFVSLDRGGLDGIRRTKWVPKNIMEMTIFIDKSSIEVFCGEGEVTISSRYFPIGEASIRIGNESQADFLRVNRMKSTIYFTFNHIFTKLIKKPSTTTVCTNLV